MAQAITTPYSAEAWGSDGVRTEVIGPVPKRATARMRMEPEAYHGDQGWRLFVLDHTIATIWIFFGLDVALLAVVVTALLRFL